MITITKTTQATNSYIKIKELPNSDLYTARARVSRTGTLDGGVVVDHLGFVQGDRTMKIYAKLTQIEEDLLWDIFTTETLVGLACRDGYFVGAIQSMTKKGGQVNFTFLVRDKE